MEADKPNIIRTTSTELRLHDADGKFSKSRIRMERDNFYGHSNNDEIKSHLIIGFDTEFNTSDSPVTLDETKAGSAKYSVLSYQVHCSIYDPAQPNAKEWSAICYPEPGERMKLVM
jgi:hypothetical protein